MNSIKIFSGFTFIELLVSLTILAVLLSLATPSFQRSITRSAIKTQAWEIRRVLELVRGLALIQQHRGSLIELIYAVPSIKYQDAGAHSVNHQIIESLQLQGDPRLGQRHRDQD